MNLDRVNPGRTSALITTNFEQPSSLQWKRMPSRPNSQTANLIVLCCGRYASRRNSGLGLELVVGQCVYGGLLLSLSVGDDQQIRHESQAYAR